MFSSQVDCYLSVGECYFGSFPTSCWGCRYACGTWCGVFLGKRCIFSFLISSSDTGVERSLSFYLLLATLERLWVTFRFFLSMFPFPDVFSVAPSIFSTSLSDGVFRGPWTWCEFSLVNRGTVLYFLDDLHSPPAWALRSLWGKRITLRFPAFFFFPNRWFPVFFSLMFLCKLFFGFSSQSHLPPPNKPQTKITCSTFDGNSLADGRPISRITDVSELFFFCG